MTQSQRRSAVLLLSVLLASPALAASEKTERRGLSATANATTFDGCTYTQLQIIASDMKTVEVSGAPSLTVSGFQFDFCTSFDYIFSGFVTTTLDPDAFTIRPSLNSARLRGSVLVPDAISGKMLSVAIDLAWEDSGDGDVYKTTQSTNAPGALTRDRSWTNMALNANVSGTVTLPTSVITSFSGEMRSERFATFTVVRQGGRIAPHAPTETVTTEAKRAFFATAQFGNQNGCVITGAFINALTRPTDASANSNSEPLMSLITLQQFNVCTHTTTLSSAAHLLPLPDGALSVSGNLSSATLNTTVDVLNDVTHTMVPVTISLTWTAIDGTSHQTTRDRYTLGDMTILTNTKGTAYDAAVTGTVSTPLGAAIADTDALAEIGSQQSSTITHSH